MLGSRWLGMSVWCVWTVGLWGAEEGHGDRWYSCEWGFPWREGLFFLSVPLGEDQSWGRKRRPLLGFILGLETWQMTTPGEPRGLSDMEAAWGPDREGLSWVYLWRGSGLSIGRVAMSTVWLESPWVDCVLCQARILLLLLYGQQFEDT